MKTKKSLSLSALPVAVVLLVLIGFTAVIGTSINESFEDTKGYVTRTISNETVTTWTNDTYETLAHRYAISIVNITNTTDHVGSGNYTLLSNKSASAVLMQWNSSSIATGDGYSAGSYNITYTYNGETDAYLAQANSTEGIFEITSNLSLLGLIVIMGAVIAVLLASFGGFLGGRSGGL